MEKDLKIGSVGDAELSAAKEGEKAQASVNVGPFKVSLVAELDNRKALEALASKLPGGMLHDAAIAMEKALFPAPSA